MGCAASTARVGVERAQGDAHATSHKAQGDDSAAIDSDGAQGAPTTTALTPAAAGGLHAALADVADAFQRAGVPRPKMRTILAKYPLPAINVDLDTWVVDVLAGKTEAPPLSRGLHGFEIPEAALRGISLEQLERIYATAKRRCVEEGWKVQSGPKAGQAVDPQGMTLYDLVHWHVKPETERSELSMVETIAEGPQPPAWFVSHWWGEPVKDFIQCLAVHQSLRGLPKASTYYWVCAYGLRQHQLEAELGNAGLDAMTSPFNRALKVADGTLTVADKDGVVFTRSWCAFESYATLITQGRTFLHDLAIAEDKGRKEGERDKQMLSDGPTAKDGPGRSLALAFKAVREKDFPTDLLMGVVTDFSLERAVATREEDMAAIKRAVGDARAEFDATMRARFGGAVLKVLHEDEPRFARWLEDLKASRLRKLSGDFRRDQEGGRGKRVGVATDGVLRTLPHTQLEEVRIGYGTVSADHAAILEEVVASGQLRTLDLARSEVPDVVGQALGRALKDPRCRLEQLNLTGNKVGEAGGRALAEGLAVNKTLTMLNISSNPAARGEVAEELKKYGDRVSFS